MSAAAHFSASYAEARAKFLAAVDRAGATPVASHRNPERGPDGGALHTDVARLGPAGARRLLVLVSGTHGIEGFAGSGCHTGWLSEGHFARQAGPDTAVLFIHAINPFGFAWERRVNEDNIDLNRNFIDHAGPHPENKDYEAIAGHVDPREWTAEAQAKHNAAIAKFLGRERHDVMCKAMHGGQYVNPKGTFYGGTAPAWSNRVFREVVNQACAKAEHIAIIDYHTGGGPYGFCDLFIDDDRAGAPSRDWFSHVTVIADDKARHGKDAQSETPGNLFYSLPEAVPGKRYSLCLVELRTGEAATGIDSIRAENWLFQHGDPATPQGRAIRAEMRARFYPERPEWKAMAFRQSNAMIGEALAGLARL
jgi:hypothetical protein